MSAIMTSSMPSSFPAQASISGEQQRVALIIQYLGTHFHGWQRQVKQRTVQAEIEQAIESVLGYSVTLHGAGRTDAGVHAAAQVAHFDTSARIPGYRWSAILNNRLPKDILIRASATVAPTWHSRFSALWRRYRYTIYTDRYPNLFISSFAWHYYSAPLDESLMQKALRPLIGSHDLEAFRRAGSHRPHSWVDMQEADCSRRGSLVHIELQASGFLYGMVRLLVGMLVEVGTGERSLDDFTEIWINQRRDLVKYAAPSQGLCLLRVGYSEFPFPPEAWQDTQPQFIFPQAIA